MDKNENENTNKNVVSIKRPRRMKLSNGNSICAKNEPEKPASKVEVSEAIMNNFKWFNRTMVKTDEECAERLNEFFSECVRTGELPTYEKMALALGTTTTTLHQWATGGFKNVSLDRINMMKKARGLIAAIDAELVSSGRIPPITYQFRAKNFYGMKDQQEVVMERKNPLEDFVDEESLRKRIEESVACDDENVIDVTDYTEVKDE